MNKEKEDIVLNQTYHQTGKRVHVTFFNPLATTLRAEVDTSVADRIWDNIFSPIDDIVTEQFSVNIEGVYSYMYE